MELIGKQETMQEQAPPSVSRAGLWAIYASSMLVMSGIQLLTPGLPIIQRDLGLTELQASLIVSVYLLPSIVFAFVSGVLANRFGIKNVFVGSLMLFGLCGLVQLPINSLWLLLVVRFVQGAAFAALAPLSIAIIGQLFSGVKQVRIQGHRLVVMLVGGSTLLPFIGGYVALIDWRIIFAIQIFAVPIAVAVWLWVPVSDSTIASGSSTGTYSKLRVMLQSKTTLAFVSADALRMFFYFAFITYLPILVVNGYGMSPAFAGTAIAISGLFAAAVAGITSRLVRLLPPSRLIFISLVFIAGSLVVIAFVPFQIPILLAGILFGMGNGTYNTLQNSGMTQMGTEDTRALFVATVGSLRNLSKFAAPTIFGMATLIMPLGIVYLITAGVAFAALGLTPALQPLDGDLVQL